MISAGSVRASAPLHSPRIGLTRPATAPYSHAMRLPRGFVPPCLPTKAPQPPESDAWLHEIKHDGFRVIARKDGDRVRLIAAQAMT